MLACALLWTELQSWQECLQPTKMKAVGGLDQPNMPMVPGEEDRGELLNESKRPLLFQLEESPPKPMPPIGDMAIGVLLTLPIMTPPLPPPLLLAKKFSMLVIDVGVRLSSDLGFIVGVISKP